jgi:hypothetical protein
MGCSSRGFDGYLVHLLHGQNNPRIISDLPGLFDSENGGIYIHRNVGNYIPNEKTGCARRRTTGPFEKSEFQGNVWPDTLMKAIERQDKQK